MQLTLDYNRVENNPESTQILRDNVKHFSRQCVVVKEAFERGEALTVWDIMTKYKIGDPRARIRDLRNAGLDIKDRKLKNRYKEYFL